MSDGPPEDIIFLSKDTRDDSNAHPDAYEAPTQLDAGVTSQFLHYDATTSLCQFVDPNATAHMLTRLETNVPHRENDSRRAFTKSLRARERIAASEAPRSGRRWFNMASSEVDERARNDIGGAGNAPVRRPLPQLQARGGDASAGTRFFQLGTVVESKAEFYLVPTHAQGAQALARRRAPRQSAPRANASRQRHDAVHRVAAADNKRPAQTQGEKMNQALPIIRSLSLCFTPPRPQTLSHSRRRRRRPGRSGRAASARGTSRPA
jgi:hypothetical protein